MRRIVCLVIAGVCGCVTGAEELWRWPDRVPFTVTVTRERPLAAGEPVGVRAGAGEGELPIVGWRVASLRVADEAGTQYKWGLYNADGTPAAGTGRAAGDATVAAGAVLTVPALAVTNGTSFTLRVYGGNATAWGVPERLAFRAADGRVAVCRAGAVERRVLADVGTADAAWRPGAWVARLPVTVANASDTARGAALAQFEAPQMALWPGRKTYRLFSRDGEIPVTPLGGGFVFRAAPQPALSRATYHVYVARVEGADPARAAGTDAAGSSTLASDIPSDQAYEGGAEVDTRAAAELLASPLNRVVNPQFAAPGEKGVPAGWRRTADLDGARFTAAADGGFAGGGRVGTEVTTATAAARWPGWHQTVKAERGRTYLYAVWMRRRKPAGGAAAAYAHVTGKGKRAVHVSVSARGRGADGWTLASTVVRVPEGYDAIEVHLTAGEEGATEYGGVFVGECAAAAVERVETPAVAAGRGGLRVWPLEPYVKVFKETPPGAEPGADGLRVCLARNEQEALQLALRADAACGVTVEVEAPRQGAAALAPEVGMVEYVPVDWPSAYYNSPDEPWKRMTPEAPGRCDGWAGWWADPVAPTNGAALAAGETRAAWILFKTDAATAPGAYRGAVRVRRTGDGAVLRELPLTVRVWDFALPARTAFPAIYDVRNLERNTAKGQSLEEARRAIYRLMSEKRLCPDRIAAEPKFRRDADGAVRADFAAYDRAAAEYFDTFGFPVSYMPGVFYLFGWAMPPKEFLKEKPYAGDWPYAGADRRALRAEYVRVYQAALRLYWEHVKAKGWDRKLVLYISDEPHFSRPEVRAQMTAACAMIHAVDPAIRVYSSTWRHCADWDGSLDIWGAGHYGCFDPAEMAARRRVGQRIWFTTDGQMCLDTPYCAVERMMPLYCHAHGADAYEFWGCTWLTHDPWEFGWHSYIRQTDTPGKYYHVRYPNGDGYLIYPPTRTGRLETSVRLEAARDGVEDHAYLRLLEALAGTDTPRAAAARALLAAYRALAPIPNAGGRYSTLMLPEPEVLGRLRRRAGELLDGARAEAGR